MCTLTQICQGIPARSASKTSLAKVRSTCVQDARIGYIQDVLVIRSVADYHIGWICTACGMPPHLRTHHPPTSPAHTPSMKSRRSRYYSGRQWHRQQTDGTKHLPRGAQRQSGGYSGVQAHGKIGKSQHRELGSTPRPRRRLTVFLSITQSASLASHCQQRRRTTPPRRTVHQHRYG